MPQDNVVAHQARLGKTGLALSPPTSAGLHLETWRDLNTPSASGRGVDATTIEPCRERLKQCAVIDREFICR